MEKFGFITQSWEGNEFGVLEIGQEIELEFLYSKKDFHRRLVFKV